VEGLYFVCPDITSALCSTKHLQRPKIAQRQRQTKQNRPEFHIVNRTLRRLSTHTGRASPLLFKSMNRHIHNSVLFCLNFGFINYQYLCFFCGLFYDPVNIVLFFWRDSPPVGQSLLIHEVSRSHTTTYHSR